MRELGIGFVPYSPLGRGFLTGTIKDPRDLPINDARGQRYPRFAEEALRQNQILVQRVRAIAERRSVKPGQLALAWYSESPDPRSSNALPQEGNVVPNIGLPLFDCTRHDAEWLTDTMYGRSIRL